MSGAGTLGTVSTAEFSGFGVVFLGLGVSPCLLYCRAVVLGGGLLLSCFSLASFPEFLCLVLLLAFNFLLCYCSFFVSCFRVGC
jgi:hypothetical protein